MTWVSRPTPSACKAVRFLVGVIAASARQEGDQAGDEVGRCRPRASSLPTGVPTRPLFAHQDAPVRAGQLRALGHRGALSAMDGAMPLVRPGRDVLAAHGIEHPRPIRPLWERLPRAALCGRPWPNSIRSLHESLQRRPPPPFEACFISVRVSTSPAVERLSVLSPAPSSIPLRAQIASLHQSTRDLPSTAVGVATPPWTAGARGLRHSLALALSRWCKGESLRPMPLAAPFGRVAHGRRVPAPWRRCRCLAVFASATAANRAGTSASAALPLTSPVGLSRITAK